MGIGSKLKRMVSVMFFLSKRGQMVSGETIKWILVVLIVVAVGFAIRNIVVRAAG